MPLKPNSVKNDTQSKPNLPKALIQIVPKSGDCIARSSTASTSATLSKSQPLNVHVQIDVEVNKKKQIKREANKLSARLSRKRKQSFIAELKKENDDLRHKQQILRSIPDLIVVFDSSGKIGFISHSVVDFLDFKPTDLEGTSFWDRLCNDSVKLLKAGFMDALSQKHDGSDTVPLGNGFLEIRLVDRNGHLKLVTLNGVLYFSGNVPECVCSIRPKDVLESSRKQQTGLGMERRIDSVLTPPGQKSAQCHQHFADDMKQSREKSQLATPISDGESVSN